MSDWWMKWAGRIALVLAELWARSQPASDGASGDERESSPQDRSAKPGTPDTPSMADEYESH